MARQRVRLVIAVAFVGLAWSIGQAQSRLQQPGAKAMFYDPSDRGLVTPPSVGPSGLRSVDLVRPFLHCGIHYWLETSGGKRLTEAQARALSGQFTAHVRSNIGDGYLTVWEVSGVGKELTPRDGQDAGFAMSRDIYDIPGTYSFSAGNAAPKIIIVWARSQSEIAQTAQRARERVGEMLAWSQDGRPKIVSETDESTPSEIGTYVTNRMNAGVVAVISFQKAP